MDKNLAWKIVLIIAVLVISIGTLYPPSKTLKPGIDLAGGTSLIYEIDAQGLEQADKKELSTRMITILRRRIDPANIQNLIWRPQGNTRFEIQMPLASPQARQKRANYEQALSRLLEENINPAVIIRSLSNPADQRAADFESFAKDSPEKLKILEDLAAAHDQRNALRTQRDELGAKLKADETAITQAGIEISAVKPSLNKWARLDNGKLTEELTNISDTDSDIQLLTTYVKQYAEWAAVLASLTDPDTGLNEQYRKAQRQLNKLSLTEDQLNVIMEMPAKSAQRKFAIDELKKEFADRTEQIDTLITAYDEYLPLRGGLDDPKDLQRMLKGAGILEFRILPTTDRSDLSPDEVEMYIESLRDKGAKFSSDINYMWFELENQDEKEAAKWIQQTRAVIGKFGDKFYVLASNKTDEAMLHGTDERDWKLKSSRPTTDQKGRRAIAFSLDERGGAMFARITGKNIERPLCILLDGLAISAPNIQVRIRTQGIITGTYTQIDQIDMVNKLNAGSLPARLIEQPISVKIIGPSIGVDNRDKGVKAGIIGLIVVVACMVTYYTGAGFIAVLALTMNLLLVLAIMALVRATFTLPGIGGMILTIGMSVDANVLIFERIREEQKRGSSLRIAIKNGYQKAFRTIFDANLTTFITAAILFWVASEEIKGFAIVLMLGIASSMFTAMFVTRTIFDLLLSKRIVKDHLVMMQLIKKPDINWIALKPVFFTISSLLIVTGMFGFFTRDDTKNNKYDIEFTGGTSVQINLKENVTLTRQQVEDRIHAAGTDLNNPALATANVYSIGKTQKQYEINTTETNKIAAIVTFPVNSGQTPETITAALGNKLSNLIVTVQSNADAFLIKTSQANKSIVKQVLSETFADATVSEPQIELVVNNAILSAFGDDLEIQLNLQPKILSQEPITEQLIESYPELTEFMGGIKITCQLEKAATLEEIDGRIKNLRFKPDMRQLTWYNYKLLSAKLAELSAGQQTKSFVYLSVEPEAGFRELSTEERQRFAENETAKVLAAGRLETSLPRVTQINPSIGAEAKTQALIAIVLSLFAIITYIWIRFGNVRYGIAAIVALVHDVCITLGAVTACTYITGTPIGQMLLIGDFKITLAIIAAFLTLIGYSLNDTIVVFDRIRENRRKGRLTAKIINDSINQTLSRTIITSFTTFIVVLVMYIFGGAGLRGFTFAIGLGIIAGTYSSIAIAAPILLIGSKVEKEK